jgi:hypothetical protein
MTEEEDRIRGDMVRHLNNAAKLCQQLPERDQDLYLALAVAAWRWGGNRLTEGRLDRMIDTLFEKRALNRADIRCSGDSEEAS